ncbi:hypothetical protein LBMAG53_27520 [Planctomycetota bacterium]|nr:hypothetical protein LBMAG53_27520 [Planctomycetota bacterium]
MKPGYIYDELLYAGDFDEVNIHLLPNIKRIRLWNTDDVFQKLTSVSIYPDHQVKAVMITDETHRDLVYHFSPTVHYFNDDGFEYVPSNEWISREPRTPIKSEVITMNEAITRWNIEIHFVDNYELLKLELTKCGIQYCEQT